MKRGLPDMITTDLAGDEYRDAAAELRPGCEWTVIDTLRRGEIEHEIALQQTPDFDPSTRVEPGHLIPPDAYVDGHISLLGDESALIVVVLHMAGKGGATLASASAVTTEEGVFAAEQDIVTELIPGLCHREAPPPASAPGAPAPTPTSPPTPSPPQLPVEYTGSVSGSAEVAGGSFHFEWSGSVTLQAVQDGQLPPQGAPAGAYRIYAVSEGSVLAHIRGGEGECTYEGEGDVPLTKGFTSGSLTVQMGTETPAYVIHLAFDPTRTITVVKSGGEGCEEEFQLPVSGYFANSQTVLTSESIGLSGNGEWPPNFGYSSTNTHWSLSPVG